MWTANTEIATTTNNINFNDSVSISSLVNSLFEVSKGTQLAVKQLKQNSSYNGAV